MSVADGGEGAALRLVGEASGGGSTPPSPTHPGDGHVRAGLQSGVCVCVCVCVCVWVCVCCVRVCVCACVRVCVVHTRRRINSTAVLCSGKIQFELGS